MKHLAIFALALMLAATPVHAQQPENQEEINKRLATDLAECSGIFLAMGNIMDDLDKKNAAQTYEDTARGAYLAGAYVNFMTGYMPDWKKAQTWAENQQEVNKSYWLGLIELHTPTEEKAFPDAFMEELKFCTDLNPIQTKLVNMMREALYSQK